jgi:hypothetical protein
MGLFNQEERLIPEGYIWETHESTIRGKLLAFELITGQTSLIYNYTDTARSSPCLLSSPFPLIHPFKGTKSSTNYR